MKQILFFLLIFNIAVSNAQDKVADEDDDTKIEVNVPVVNPYAYLDSINYSRKKMYNVAFLLPISVYKISLGDGKERPTSMPQETREVLGFWEGVNIAFAKIKNMNAKFNFHIWDNEKNDTTTANIIEGLPNYKIDAVIAPFHTKQALMVSEYCKNNKIPMFLAQNPSDVPAKNNPYSFKFHVPKNRLFYDYYLKTVTSYADKNTDIFFVFDGLNKSERKVANYLKYMSEKDGSKRLKLLEYSSDLVLKNYLDTTRNSLFMISYYNTATVNEILQKIDNLQPYNVKVFGHNLWSTNSKLNMELLEKLQARVFTDFYYGNNKPLLNEVKSSYSSLTKDNSVSDVFLGYDVAMYVAEVLDRYGIKFPLSLDKYRYNGVVTNVSMKPTYDGKSKLLFFENSTKFLLKATKDGWILEE